MIFILAMQPLCAMLEALAAIRALDEIARHLARRCR